MERSRVNRDALENQAVARDGYGRPLRHLTGDEKDERDR